MTELKLFGTTEGKKTVEVKCNMSCMDNFRGLCGEPDEKNLCTNYRRRAPRVRVNKDGSGSFVGPLVGMGF